MQNNPNNKLSLELSPYLLQHANNPVDWLPWGEEALNRAKVENKPILVSIGYSACHWCHVMEHESFEDPEIAKIMNAFFINIKVDREERPDVDSVYMDALHTMGLRGGWPLNVFLMPNAKPFYGGTYFPKNNWANLLHSIHNAFENEFEKLNSSAEGFAKSLNQKDSEKYNLHFDSDTELSGFTDSEIEKMVLRLNQEFDFEHGGMSRSPKFPMPSVWLFLVRYASKFNNEVVLNHIKLSLDRIALGGIFDHLSGGWTRYSTDERWKIPHFEKMLYDNGQLLSLYSEAIALFQSKNIFQDSQEIYNAAIRKTINWLKTEMLSKENGFFSAQDADSEGEEGKYYVWKKDEIIGILKDKAPRFKELFEISVEGNWEHGNNVLHLENIPNVPWNELEDDFSKLLKFRENRIKPGLDNKIICSWNGLMLNGLVAAYRYSANKDDLKLAVENANFIKNNLCQDVVNEDGETSIGLVHLYNNNKLVFGFLDDYAAVIQGFVALYQVDFDIQWLHYANSLCRYSIANFFDETEGLFYFTDSQSESLIARKKEIFDNVIPSSNSIMAFNLFNLGQYFDNFEYIEISKQMFGMIKKLCLQDIQWLSNWANFGLGLSSPINEIIIVSENAQLLKQEFDRSIFMPYSIFAAQDKQIDLPLLQYRTKINDIDTFYVCFDKTCRLPSNNLLETITELQKNG